MSGKRILIVEDDPDIAELVRFNLAAEGYKVEIQSRGLSGLDRARTNPPDLLILDLMLPDLPGIEICKRLRASEATARLPILMLTAKGEEIDRVVGFEVGADDYVTKPFGVRELMLRVRALLRRSSAGPDTKDTYRVGEVTLDTQGHRLQVGSEEIPLTSTEFKLLVSFFESPTRLFSRMWLLEHVWDYAEGVESRTVDAHIRRLRKKLGKHADLIETVHGAGYRFNLAQYDMP
ncbi:MAG: response regulator [Deltaproteobacteria bacterium]|nr:response regulator [Deltaproteobacteria bacterium]